LFYVFSTNVTVGKVHVFIQYTGTAGYLASNIDQKYSPFRIVYGDSNYTYPGFSANGIKQYTLQLSLLSNANETHKILSIQVQTVGFTILSVKPSTPITIPAQTQALNIQIFFQTPFLGYNGDLSILLQVT
jgi:hypothetical protein